MATKLEVPERRAVDVDGPVHYREWNGPAGLTLVLVHGLGGSHLSWTSVAPELARHGRVLVPDLPGFGHTPRAGRRSTLHAHRRVLSGFIRATAPGRTVLIGNSMGGVLALLQAALEPGSATALVLTGSAFPWARGGMPAPIVIGGFALYRTPVLGRWAVRQRFRRADPDRLVRLGFRVCTADPSSIPRDLYDAHVDLLRERREDPDAPAAFLEAARSLLRLGARPDLCRQIMDRVACPLLVVHGRRDRLVPVEFAEAAVRAHPSWRLRILPGLGHVPQMEAPDRWLGVIEDWLGTVA